MEATELRIGNYINPKINGIILTNEIHKVDPTTLMMISKQIDNRNIEFEPIPLTEEILLKCGFEYYKESKSYELDCDFSVTIWGKYDSENNLHVSCDEIGIEIHYLHQLQNLYFALTGKELEIDL